MQYGSDLYDGVIRDKLSAQIDILLTDAQDFLNTRRRLKTAQTADWSSDEADIRELQTECAFSFQAFSKKYEDACVIFHSLQPDEQFSEEVKADIKRECYRILDHYFEGIVEGDFSVYFHYLLEGILRDGKINWSIIPKEANKRYLESDEIDQEIALLASYAKLKLVKAKFNDLNQFGEQDLNIKAPSAADDNGFFIGNIDSEIYTLNSQSFFKSNSLGFETKNGLRSPSVVATTPSDMTTPSPLGYKNSHWTGSSPLLSPPISSSPDASPRTPSGETRKRIFSLRN